MVLLCGGVGEEGPLVKKTGGECFKMLTKRQEKKEHNIW